MKKEQVDDILKMAEELNSIKLKLAHHHVQQSKVTHEMYACNEHLDFYVQKLLVLFNNETCGRSLSSGLSDMQRLLAKTFEALDKSRHELEVVCRKLKGISSTLHDAYTAIDISIESLEGIKNKESPSTI